MPCDPIHRGDLMERVRVASTADLFTLPALTLRRRQHLRSCPAKRDKSANEVAQIKPKNNSLNEEPGASRD